MDWIDGKPFGRFLRAGLLAAAAVVVLSAQAGATRADSLVSTVRALRAERLDLGAQRESLRARIAQAAVKVDSLKRVLPAASGALRQTLARAVAWVALEDSLSRKLSGLQVTIGGVRAQAATAVDREMAAIATTLMSRPDADVVRRLDRLRAARRTLEEDTGETAQPPAAEPIEVGADDGPEEIRQKADLMWDLAAQVKRQADQARSRLEGLRTEERLRRQLAVFAGDVGFFDEHPTAGRTVSAAVEVDKSGPGQEDATLAGPESDRAPAVSEQPLAGTGPALGEGRRGPPDLGGAEGIGTEMTALQVRIRTLEGRERSLRAQSDALRRALQRMLEAGP